MIVTFNVEKNSHFIVMLNASGKQKETNQGLSNRFHCGKIKGFLLEESLIFTCSLLCC